MLVRRLVMYACLSVVAVALIEAQSVESDAVVLTQQPREITGQAVLQKREQDARVSLDMRNSTRLSIIKALAQEAQLKTTFIGDMKALDSRINAKFSDVDVMDAIREVLRGTGLSAKMASDGVTLMIRPEATSKDGVQVTTGEVAGVVIDSSTRKPLSGVTITVAGTQLGATSDASGRFVISRVPSGAHELLIKLLGYRSLRRAVDIKAGETARVNMEMVPATTMLSGVVTTATGVQDRRSIGNDITVLNVDSIVRMTPVSSLSDILETRVPGLTVIHSSGIPGAPVKYRLRGIGGGLVSGATNTSNDPIFIVDGIRVYGQTSTKRDGNLAPTRNRIKGGGVSAESAPYPVPSPIEQIDWNNIETIEVFKGPSATSQWGADAGNGVIVITTKKGRPGKTQISLSLATSAERMMGTFADPGYFRFAHPLGRLVSRQCSIFVYGGDCAVTDSIVQFQALSNPQLSPFGTGTDKDGSFSLSGGSDAARYSFTGSTRSTIGYLKMPKFYSDLYRDVYDEPTPSWMLRPTGYDGWAIATSVVANPFPDLATTISTRLSSSDVGRASGQDLLSEFSSVYIDTMALRRNSDFGGLGGSEGTSLREFLERGRSKDVTSDIGIQTQWRRWNSVTLSATAGINTVNREDRTYVRYGYKLSNEDTTGSFALGTGNAVTRTGRLNANFLTGRLVSAAAGLEITQIATRDVRARSDTLAPGVAQPIQFYQSGQSSTATTTAGWFFEPKLNVSSRFFVVPGFRLDGGSAARGGGRGRGSGIMAFFPKLNFSWIAIDREGDTPLWGAISMLRPRLAFGVAGVQPEPSWSLRMMSSNGLSQSGTEVAEGIVLQSLGNPELRPERSREVEGGFELSLWNARVNLNISAHHKLRTDAIQQLSLAPSIPSKVLGYYANVGRIRNTGLELSGDATVWEADHLSVRVDGSISTNNNIVVELYGDQKYYVVTSDYGGSRLQKGYPVNGRWGRPIVGYNKNPSSGRIGFDDYSLADSAVYLGAGFPKWQMPFGATFSLAGGVSVVARMDYKNGLTQFNSGNLGLLERLYVDPNSTLEQQAMALAASADIAGTFGEKYGSSNALVQSVTSLRFNSLSVNYNVPRSWMARFGVPSASISLHASNLGLWTNYRGKDPDVNSITLGDDVRDNGEAPPPRTLTLRLTLRN